MTLILHLLAFPLCSPALNNTFFPAFSQRGRPKTVERHQVTARYVGDPPLYPTYQTSGGGGGLGEKGVVLYPLLGVRHAEQCRRTCVERTTPFVCSDVYSQSQVCVLSTRLHTTSPLIRQNGAKKVRVGMNPLGSHRKEATGWKFQFGVMPDNFRLRISKPKTPPLDTKFGGIWRSESMFIPIPRTRQTTQPKASTNPPTKKHG